jgi:UDP-N-acetyl-D-glucosamine/UDP-N-acetyl-D-galactosamine dehydrogenase
VHDPLAIPEDTKDEYGILLTPSEKLEPADAVILAVVHQSYLAEGWPLMQRLLCSGGGVVLDVKSRLDRASKPEGLELWRL